MNRKLRTTTEGSSVCSHVRIKTKYQITKVAGCYVFFKSVVYVYCVCVCVCLLSLLLGDLNLS